MTVSFINRGNWKYNDRSQVTDIIFHVRLYHLHLVMGRIPPNSSG